MLTGHAGIIDLLRYAAVAAELLAIARIVHAGVARRFRCFLSLLVADLGLSLAILPFSTSSAAYRNIWLISQPLIMLALAAAAYEVFSALTEGYSEPGPVRSGMMRFVLPVGALVGTALSWSHVFGVAWRAPLLQGAFIARRAESIGIAAALIAANVILAVSPAPLRANAIAHGRIFCVYVTCQAIAYFAMVRDYVELVQFALVAVSIACFIAWALQIRPSGDELPGKQAARDSIDFEEALRRMNESL